MKADAEQYRKRIDALWGNRDALLSQIFRDGWKLEPPDPGWRTATSQASPTPQTFYHKKIGIWLPHVFFEDVPAPPCPTKDCMGKDCLVDVNSGREWPTGLHRVFGVFGSWWLDTCKFTCRRCGARFHATSADSVAQLPLHARLTFDVFMGKKYACDAALAKLIEDTWEPMGTSPTQLLLHHFYSENHYAAELKYYAVTVQRRADERADDDASTPAGAAPTAQSLALTGLDGAAAKAVRIANELVRRRRDDDARRQRPQATTAPCAHPTGPLHVPLPTGPLHLPRPPMTVPFGFLLPGAAPPPPCCAPRQYDAALATAAPWQVAPVPRPVVGEKPDYRRDCKTCGRPKGAHTGRSPFGPRCTLPRARLEELL